MFAADDPVQNGMPVSVEFNPDLTKSSELDIPRFRRDLQIVCQEEKSSAT